MKITKELQRQVNIIILLAVVDILWSVVLAEAKSETTNIPPSHVEQKTTIKKECKCGTIKNDYSD